MKTFKQFLLEEDSNQLEKLIDVIRRDCKPFLSEEVILYRGIKTTSNKTFVDGLEDLGALDIKARKDRKSKDSTEWVHNALGTSFKKAFGINFRTEAVFAAQRPGLTLSYGWSYVIFPKGDFDYVWSPVIQDGIEFESNLVSGSMIDTENPEKTKQLFDVVMEFLYAKIDISRKAKIELSKLKSFSELKKLVNSIGNESPESLSEAETDILSLYRIADSRQFTKLNLLEFLEKNIKHIYNFNENMRDAPERTEIMVSCDSYYAIPTNSGGELFKGSEFAMDAKDFLQLIRK